MKIRKKFFGAPVIETPVDTGFLPFFDDKPVPPTRGYYKIYHDGGHFIAQTRIQNTCRRNSVAYTGDTTKDMYFDTLYFNAMQAGFSGKKKDSAELNEYLKEGLLKLYPDTDGVGEYIEQRTERVLSNLHKRKKLFKRKANLNRWNYFVTITYDDLKHTEDSFRQKVRKTLSNLHTRRGWKYMGVFERSPETGRLHIHALVYVPDGEMIGTLAKKTDYSTKSGEMQTYTENSFFERNYGRNDFKEVHPMSIQYLLKYIGKTGEKIMYSRGIPAAIIKELNDSDLAVQLQDFALKFVLWDDVIDWEKDVRRYKPVQGNIWGLLCNPQDYCSV